MLEDVVTTGGSSLRAIQHARDFGLTVNKIFAIVDRGQTSKEIFADEFRHCLNEVSFRVEKISKGHAA